MKGTYVTLLLIVTVSWNPQLVNAQRTYTIKVNHNESTADHNELASEITSELKKEIGKDSKLSKHSRDIKVTRGNGYLVLRGIVNSDKEKIIVNDLAHKCYNSEVLNELEVKSPTTDMLPYAQIP